MEDRDIIEDFESIVKWWQEDIDRHRKKIAEAEKEMARCRRIIEVMKERARDE